MTNVVIVGANRGIGYYIAKQLLEDGNNVSVLDLETGEIDKLKEQYGEKLVTFLADATDENSVKSAVAETVDKFGCLDVAIHNACLCTFDGEQETGYEVYKRVLDVNYFGALRLAKAVLPYMRERKSGRVIFTSSGVGVTGFGNISPYASSKGAIESLAKCLAIENENYGITFHLMHPPLTRTDSSSGLPVPKEFMADAETVGRGLGKRIFSPKFVICHSLFQTIQMRMCYRKTLKMGRMMWKMTQRAKDN